MAQADITGIEKAIHYLMPIVRGALRGYCFYRFAKPFMGRPCVPSGGLREKAGAAEVGDSGARLSLSGIFREKAGAGDSGAHLSLSGIFREKGAALGGLAYFLVILLLYTKQLSMDAYVVYGMGSLAMLLVICRADKRNYRQKIFLGLTFFSLNWLAAAIAEILYDFLYDAAASMDYMQNHPELSPVLYLTMCVCDLALELLFTAVGLWQVVRVYGNKSEELGKRELLMLTLPSLMGLIGYEIMRYYRVFYVLKTGEMEKTYDRLTLLFCGVSSLTVIAVIMLYQGIRAKQEERQQAEFLAAQIDNIRRHMDQVENLYQNIRSIRHDMTNHVLTLERLYEERQTEEAEAYNKALKKELAQMKGKIETGNPVTNVILREFAGEAKKRGISFYSEFYYPTGTAIDAFDLSVILNNALQNAVDNAESGADSEGKEKRISVISYRRNNAYIIEVRNSFSGELKWNPESGLPITFKGQGKGHGYGLPNIRRVASHYSGDLDITVSNGEFLLCILLMTE